MYSYLIMNSYILSNRKLLRDKKTRLALATEVCRICLGNPIGEYIECAEVSLAPLIQTQYINHTVLFFPPYRGFRHNWPKRQAVFDAVFCLVLEVFHPAETMFLFFFCPRCAAKENPGFLNLRDFEGKSIFFYLWDCKYV